MRAWSNTWNRWGRNVYCDQLVIAFGFASDWLSRWCAFFKPIAEHSKAKPKQFRIMFDTQLKTAEYSCTGLIYLNAVPRQVQPFKIPQRTDTFKR